MHLNFEFKAKANNIDLLEAKLLELNPIFHGIDYQKDTYYKVTNGRLKLREGNIENALIYYERQNTANAKQSDVILYNHQPNSELKKILEITHGIKVVVEKQRKIYFLENIKFHFDTLPNLGNFIEVEAIDSDGKIGIEKLKKQCDFYSTFFNLSESDFIKESYSDLVFLSKLNR